MDDYDKTILNLIQAGFPLTTRPFQTIGDRVGLSEDEVLNRLQRLKDMGIIRRIGAVFDPKKLGFASTLCSARVPEEKLRAFADIVNAFPGVTHNYRRNYAYNVWFTLIAPTEEALEGILAEIKDKTGITDILSMKAIKTYKINALFEV
jgi:DNA-binding Lrp family transcriptional regulator